MLGRLGQLGLNLMGGWMSQITVRLCSASVAGLLQGIWDPTNLQAVQHNQVLHSRDSTAWISKTCTTHLPIVRVCSSACDHASWILFHTVSNYGSYSHCSTLCDSIVQYRGVYEGEFWTEMIKALTKNSSRGCKLIRSTSSPPSSTSNWNIGFSLLQACILYFPTSLRLYNTGADWTNKGLHNS